MIGEYHAKLFAYELNKGHSGMHLDAQVDQNLYQVELNTEIPGSAPTATSILLLSTSLVLNVERETYRSAQESNNQKNGS